MSAVLIMAGGVAVSSLVFQLAIFVMAIFVGYYVVWSVTPALHTPLMAVTNAISSVIIVGGHFDMDRLCSCGALRGEYFWRLSCHPAHARDV